MKITKQELVDQVSTQVKGITKANLRTIIDAMLQAMVDGFRNGQIVHLKDFGHFRVDVVTRGSHQAGPNPLGKTVRFRASKELRKLL